MSNSPTFDKIFNFIKRSLSMTKKVPSTSDIAKKTGVARSNVSNYIKKIKTLGLLPEDAPQIKEKVKYEWIPCSKPCDVDGAMLEVQREDGSIFQAKNINKGWGDVVIVNGDTVPLKNFKQYKRFS